MLPKKIYSKTNINESVTVANNEKKDEVDEMLNENNDEVVDAMDVSELEEENTEEKSAEPTLKMPIKQKKVIPQKLSEETKSQPVPVDSDTIEEDESEMLDENSDEDIENAADEGEQQDESEEVKTSENPVKTSPNPALKKRTPPPKPAPLRSISPARNIQNDNHAKTQTAMQKTVQSAKQVVQKFSGDRFQSVKTVSVSRRSSRTGAWLSVVNAVNGNKRISLGNELMMNLNNPEQVQIRYSDEEIAISEFFADEDSCFNIRLGSKGNQKIIYSAGLIDEITERFDLDFTGISCISFYKEDATVDNDYDNPVVVIRIKQ